MIRRGMAYTLAILFNRVVPASLIRVFWVYVYELADDSLSPPECEFQVQRVPPGEKRVQLAELTQYTPAEDDSVVGWAVFQQEKMLGGMWMANEEFEERAAGFRIILSENQRWLMAARLSPKSRSRGAYSCLLHHVLRDASVPSNSRFFAAINPVNRRSLLAHQSRIRGTAGWLLCLRLFGRTMLLRCGGDLRKQDRQDGSLDVVIRSAAP